jgi:hypothetical protein
MTTVTLTANVPTAEADSLGLAAGAGRQTGAVLDIKHESALQLVRQGLASFGSTAQNAALGSEGVKAILKGTATLDFPSVAAGAATSLTIAVAGAAVGDPVVVGTPAVLPAGAVPVGYVSAAGVVTVRVENNSAAAIDLASATWHVAVVNF